EFFQVVRAKWLHRASALESGDPERDWLERLAGRFDRDNYKVARTPEGQELWEFVGEDLNEEARRELEQANEAQMLLTLPMQIRKILDGELEVGEQQFADLLRLAREQESHQSDAPLDLFTPAEEAEHR